MGLFDFAKDLGRKLFDRDDDAPAEIARHIQEDNPGIDDLKVAFKEGVVDISGKASSADAVEKAVLMAGNVAGVEEVRIDDLDAPAVADSVQYYVVESGDTLSGIAKRFYGNAMDYPKIFEANREVIKNPDLIFPGQKIRIPA